ncbi:hypothetical protein [Vreelandella neptunia]|uniref:Uncharacterized protein n=1 Tax=Vreelandella neptunia TaxID=115551 RepID=A0ABZ0YJH4_9GAMM|nr:hypothetical protein [Halomonas neptunia]MDN3559805.1 hypothetical protein [Halomonas neptunia]WQH11422.1 hypothetical protein SR894_14800 [Halomonas neptunia]
MDISYSDFVYLCRIRDPQNIDPSYELRTDGVYVKDIPSDIHLEPGERAAHTEHPTGDLTQPCLRFPCNLEQLQEFLEWSGMYGCIDPFDMADWVKEKLSKAVRKTSTQQVKPSHLLTIAALLELLKDSVKPRYNQSAIIDSIVDNNKYVRGLSQGNLEPMFGAANKALEEARKNSLP